MSATIDICSCAACGYSPLDSSSCQCRVCGVKLCSTCSFITKNEKKDNYTCIACLGADLFYDKLRIKAKGIQDRTAGVLSGSIKLDKYSAQTLFFHCKFRQKRFDSFDFLEVFKRNAKFVPSLQI